MEEYISDNSLYIRSKNNSMINRKMIGRVLGMLLFIELGMFLLCAGVSAGYGESDGNCQCFIYYQRDIIFKQHIKEKFI